MKAWLCVGMALAACAYAFAQSPESPLSEKMKSLFATKSSWLTDLDKARAEAKQSGKHVFAYFSMEG